MSARLLTLRHGRWSLRFAPRSLWVNAALLTLILAGALLALSLGRRALTPSEIWAVVSGHAPPGPAQQILLNIRLPRVLTVLCVGAALGASGAVFQSVSRNVLGSPDVIGFTAGAATGALVQIVLLGDSGRGVAPAALAGGLLTALAVYGLARRNGHVGGYRLVLTGIGVGAVLTALNGLILVKGDLDAAVTATLWLAGSVHAREWRHVLPVAAGLVLLIPMIAGMRPLAMIAMGDDTAHQLGIRVERVRLWMLAGAVVLAALATSAAGPIAFIALAAPQLAQRLARSPAQPLIGAALMGATLLCAADILTQILPFRATVPVGQLTGIIGGLYLIWLLTRRRSLST